MALVTPFDMNKSTTLQSLSHIDVITVLKQKALRNRLEYNSKIGTEQFNETHGHKNTHVTSHQ